MKQEVEIKLRVFDGQKTFESRKISGKLNSLIINSTDRVSITIESELGYLIFHDPQFEGSAYKAPRTRAVSMFSDRFGLQDSPNFDKFSISERLNFLIIGPDDAKVSILMRFD